MKVVVSTLAILVLFLFTQCMIAGNNLAFNNTQKKTAGCTKKKSCSKNSKPACDKKAEKQEEKGCRDLCNPFMSCCGCLYDCVPKNDFSIIKPLPASVKNGYKCFYFPSSYISGIWQPPEFVI